MPGEPVSDLAQTLAAARASLGELTSRIVGQIWGRLPGYEDARMRREDLELVVRPNLEVVVASLTEGRRPREGELRWAVHLGSQRALQGVPIESMVHAWRTAERVMLDALLGSATSLGADGLRRVTGMLALVFDEMTRASVAAYRRAQEEITVRFERVAADLVARLAVAERVDPEEVAASARLVEVDPDRPYLAVALGSGEPAAPAALERAHRHALASVAALAPGRILSGTHQGRPLLLVPVTDEHRLGSTLERALRRPEAGAPVIAGLGEPQPRLASIGASCAQAMAALEAGLHAGLGPVVRYADVIPEVLLLHNRAAAARLVSACLGPLLAQPRLVSTLRTYLASGLSVRRTAGALGVHPNTVAYRLERLRELLGGRDLRDAAALLDVTLALRALELLGPPGG